MNVKVKRPKKKFKINVFLIISLIVLSAYTILLFLLLGWGLINSLKHEFNFTLYPAKLFPEHDLMEIAIKTGSVKNGFEYYFGNYLNAFKLVKLTIEETGDVVYMPHMLLYSIYWAVGSSFLNVFTTALVAYCCARFSSKMFSKIIYYTIVFIIAIPLIGTMPAQLRLVSDLRLYNNLLLMPALKLSFTSSYFLVFYSIFRRVPDSFREAARVRLQI